jgi:hypothetical protein
LFVAGGIGAWLVWRRIKTVGTHKLGGLSRVAAAVAGVIGVFLVYFLLADSTKQHLVPPLPVASRPDAAAAEAHAATEPSVHELWDRFTAPRIPLDGKESPEELPAAESTPPSPPKTPAWVLEAPHQVGEVYRQVISSDRFSSLAECRHQLEGKLLAAVADRVRQNVTNHRWAGDPISPAQLGVTLDYVLRELCTAEFPETVESPSLGELQVDHMLVEFTPAQDELLRERWLQYERRSRFTHVATIAGSLLAMLASVYGLIQFDTYTRGYYTRQLLIGGVVVIIGVGLLCVA